MVLGFSPVKRFYLTFSNLFHSISSFQLKYFILLNYSCIVRIHSIERNVSALMLRCETIE